jgi:poly(3-hydroxybutyrate) depolymerase
MPVRIPVDETITFRDQTFVNLDFAREYLLFAPPCWPRWLFQARGLGRGGLPLVVSLHGASMDARLFAKQWRYYWEAWVDPETRAAVDLEDQFFVLVPAGTHTVDAPLGGDPFALPFDDKLLWNGAPVGVDVRRDDVAFVRKMVEHAERSLQRAALNPEAPVFDPDRMFLHGYSNGAGLAHRLVWEEPDRWAAVWAQSGMMSRQDGIDPPPGNRARFGPRFELATQCVSLFAHHGVLDTTVPPGDRGTFGVAPEVPELLRLLAGGVPRQDALQLTPHYGSLSDCVEAYRAFNGLTGGEPIPTLEASIGGLSLQWVSPRFTLLNGANPQVVEYRDSAMTHINLGHPPEGYGSFRDVWAFFRAHPRVPRLVPYAPEPPRPQDP